MAIETQELRIAEIPDIDVDPITLDIIWSWASSAPTSTR